MSKIIAEGAEAKIYIDKFGKLDCVIKERISKNYRNPVLDKSILSKRIKSEARILNLAKISNINCPSVYYSDNKKIIMEYLPFKESKDIIKTKPLILKQIAKDVFKLHKNNIIHGDLTLCNILYNTAVSEAYFIDFGLSYVSTKNEDKAMDLEVLREIIIADFSDKIWKIFENEYKKLNPEIITHMEKIQKRKKYLS